MVIYKYTLSPTDYQQIEMPMGSQILSVQNQKEEIVLWAAVTQVILEETREILIIGTGNPFDESGLKYIGTVQQMDGRLVWHVFEKRK